MAAGPPPVLPNPPVVDPSDPGYPSADNAARNQAAQLQLFADHLNAVNYATYKGLMEGYQTSVDAGRQPSTPPPAPPLRYVVENGALVVSAQSMDVIAVKPLEGLKSGLDGGGTTGVTPNTTDLGGLRGSIGYNCGPRDTNPVGTTISLPDGTKIKKVNWGPFGFFYQFV